MEGGRQLQLDDETDPSPRTTSVTCGGHGAEDCEGDASGVGSIESTASFRGNTEGARNDPAEKQRREVGVDRDGGFDDGGESEGEGSDDEEDDEEEEEEPLSFAVALTLLQDHPAADEAFVKPRWVKECRLCSVDGS